jgi:hypothetical protein
VLQITDGGCADIRYFMRLQDNNSFYFEEFIMPPFIFYVLIASSLIWVYGYSLSWTGLLLFFVAILVIALMFSLALKIIYDFVFLHSAKHVFDEKINSRFNEINDEIEKNDKRKRAVLIFTIAYVVSFLLGSVVKYFLMLIPFAR